MADKKISELVLDSVVDLASEFVQARAGQNYKILASTLETFFRRFDDSHIPQDPFPTAIPLGDNVQDALNTCKDIFLLFGATIVPVASQLASMENQDKTVLIWGAETLLPLTPTVWLRPGFVAAPAGANPFILRIPFKTPEQATRVRAFGVNHNTVSDVDIQYRCYINGTPAFEVTVFAGNTFGETVVGDVPIVGGDTLEIRVERAAFGIDPIDVVAVARLV